MKTIFFDIGEVLVDLRWHKTSERWGKRTNRPPAELQALLYGEGRKEPFDRGDIDAETYFASVTDAAGDGAIREATEVAFRELLEPRTWLGEAFDRLALRYHLGLISNIDPVHFAVFDAETTFRGITRSWLSFRYRQLKPHPSVFATALHNANVRDPADALLIDDRSENVAAAWEAGMKAVLVPDEDALRTVVNGLLETVRDCPYEKTRDCSRTCPDFRTCRGALRRPGRA